ncbi:MAG TPA: leucyl aminopeptidase [Anaerolineales bacterium]
MSHINLATRQEHQGICITLAAAPEEISPNTVGREPGEVRFNPADQTATLSVGAKDKVTLETFRRAGGSLAKWLTKNKVTEAAIVTASFSDFELAPDQIAFALAEGLLLGSFRFDKHKSKKEKASPATIYFLDDSFKSALERASIICEATNLTRAWAHEPANVINPVSLAERVQELAKEVGLKCTVLDDKQLTEMGAGAIVAVGQGSANPSRLIVLEYQPSAGKEAKPVVLVGKAITFDTGGYSIKTMLGMVGMKYDKCGAMAVVGMIFAAAKLKLPIPLVGILAASENMISEIAYRPNDILKTLSGKTVEIISTDAEGRLVLCDALTYAQQNFDPRALIDLATLTGGIVTALGSNRAGLFSNNDELANRLFAAGTATHERLWRMPLDEEYFEMIKSVDADMKNSAGMVKASPIIGATFLKQFVDEKTPWAHLDIAGVSDWDIEMPYCPKGASGFGVRLLVEYLDGLE